jgi:hypothetical protein
LFFAPSRPIFGFLLVKLIQLSVYTIPAQLLRQSKNRSQCSGLSWLYNALRQTQPRVDCDGTTECLSARLAVDRNFVAVSKLDADVELLLVER